MKKNILTIIIFVISTLIFVSCVPNVSKTITKLYPPIVTDSTFNIYYDNKEVPQEVDIIGTLSITDGVFTTNCDSVSIFNLAKKEVSQSGGNALLITKYSIPSISGSKCHQIEGIILRIVDNSDGILTSSTNIPTTITDFKIEKPRYLPKVILSLDGGYGWRTATISPDLDYEQKQFLKNLTSGFVWDASASFIFKKGYGVKLTYLQYLASHSINAYNNETYQTGTLSTKHNISYVGPAFVTSAALGKYKNWISVGYVGLGYMMYYDSTTFRNDFETYTGATVGFQLGWSIDYKIYPELAIGINAELLSGILTSWEVNSNGNKYNESLPANSGEGLGQFRIMAGLRYYIK